MAASVPTASSLGAGFREMYIGGKWTDSSSGETLEIINPATESVLSTVSAGSPRDVDAAVTAARAQFDGGEWSKMPGAQRGCFVQEEELGVPPGLHDTPPHAFVFQPARDPTARLILPHDSLAFIVQNAAVAHQQSASRQRDDRAERRYAILIRH